MRWFPDNLWNRSWFFWSVFHLLLCVHLLLILTPGMMGNPLTSRSHSSTDEFVSEMYKCPDVCKCELILKRSSQGASIGTSSNYKVRSNCYRQRVRHLSWTHSLSNLTVQLSLQRNLIRVVRNNSFRHLESLQKLNLSYNIIEHIEDGAFDSLTTLKKLDLTGNQLMQISIQTFTGLYSLTDLLLGSNHLSGLPEHSLKHSINTLQQIDLKQNPLGCFCSLTWLIKLRNRIRISSVSVCYSPMQLYGKSLTEIAFDQMFCEFNAEGVESLAYRNLLSHTSTSKPFF